MSFTRSLKKMSIVAIFVALLCNLFNIPFVFTGSPRAYVDYNYTGEVPCPEPFVNGIRNSFPDPKERLLFSIGIWPFVLHFLLWFWVQKHRRGKKDKDKLIYIFLGIIPSQLIAGVMNDGKFSASLITARTQIVMMDEWTPDSLACEDAKRVLQGKYTSFTLLEEWIWCESIWMISAFLTFHLVWALSFSLPWRVFGSWDM